ncbi:hypothetical protein NIES2130_37500 [Scytonema sp. HK-05]|nr:hypothetical protein NIES2130_37500 [Scytonema sp. HK-05]
MFHKKTPAKPIQLTVFNIYFDDSFIFCKSLLSIQEVQISAILLLAGISLYKQTKNMQEMIKKQLINIFSGKIIVKTS